MPLFKVDARSERPGWWMFEPKGKPGQEFRMLNLGGAISISESKAAKLYELYREHPERLWQLLEQSYNFEFHE